jgi:hypothetical protein
MAAVSAIEKQVIRALSLLTLNPNGAGEALQLVASLSPQQRDEFLSIADSNHVVVRSLEPLAHMAERTGNKKIAVWARAAVEKEYARIANALPYLHKVCDELESAGSKVTVMKSLDHWPDLGNDLDLYAIGNEQKIADCMTSVFNAHIEARSWGDRLAHKWNFAIPGLPEAVEIHINRLGQTGEHTAMARRFVTRRIEKTVRVPGTAVDLTYLVPAAEERVIVATLQRMYRHFYFRVCDIVNTAELVEAGTINYVELKRAADMGGIWKGVCSYLKIVSDYVLAYRGYGLDLPKQVLDSAPFGGEKVFVRARFIRVPIMPQGAELYTEQVTRAALRGDVPATFRLSLMPGLATAAAISFKLTGSDKGIW